MTLVSEGATRMEPTEPTPKKPSLTFVQLIPASVVLKTPPPVPPK